MLSLIETLLLAVVIFPIMFGIFALLFLVSDRNKYGCWYWQYSKRREEDKKNQTIL